jgi:hypothetical protein
MKSTLYYKVKKSIEILDRTADYLCRGAAIAVRLFPRTPGVAFAGRARRLHHGFYGVVWFGLIFSQILLAQDHRFSLRR